MIASLIAGWGLLYFMYVLGLSDSLGYAGAAVLLQALTLVTFIYLAWKYLP